MLSEEPKINEVFVFGDQKYKCIPCSDEIDHPCIYCEASDELCDTGKCMSSKREDKISVLYIKA